MNSSIQKIEKREDVEVRYANWLKQLVDQIAPKNLILPLGRAAGKTSDFLAERAMDIVYDMPGAFIAVAADTYMNAIKNVLPSMYEGWTRKGWIEGLHYVKDVRPPDHFGKPYKPVDSFKHTVTTFNGVHFKIVSMDRPSTGAGDSFQHIIGDEAKYLKKKKIDKLIPAIRGEYVRFSKSPYYRGKTFTSDLANPSDVREDDWFLDLGRDMNVNQIHMIVQVASVLNNIKIELLKAIEKKDNTEISRQEKALKKWEERHRRIRQDSTLFYVASSLINVDNLTIGYFIDTLKALGENEFKASVLSIKQSLEKGQRFYPNITDKHFFSDGYNYGFLDTQALGSVGINTCRGLKYHIPTLKLEAGFDAGNMMSLTVAQHQGENLRVLKFLYTLAPEWIEHLAKKFVDFFAFQELKILDLYYDRAANNYSKAGKDFATELKNGIEQHNGQYTGWTVNLMSRNQGNITQQQEYDIMMKIGQGYHPNLPKLLIDKHECRQLKSSIENAPVKISKSGERTIIQKDKASEKLPIHRLPMESTNPSDSLKYLICRPKWLAVADGKPSHQLGDPTTV